MRRSVQLEAFDVEISDLDLFRCGVCVFGSLRLEMFGFGRRYRCVCLFCDGVQHACIWYEKANELQLFQTFVFYTLRGFQTTCKTKGSNRSTREQQTQQTTTNEKRPIVQSLKLWKCCVWKSEGAYYRWLLQCLSTPFLKFRSIGNGKKMHDGVDGKSAGNQRQIKVWLSTGRPRFGTDRLALNE